MAGTLTLGAQDASLGAEWMAARASGWFAEYAGMAVSSTVATVSAVVAVTGGILLAPLERQSTIDAANFETNIFRTPTTAQVAANPQLRALVDKNHDLESLALIKDLYDKPNGGFSTGDQAEFLKRLNALPADVRKQFYQLRADEISHATIATHGKVNFQNWDPPKVAGTDATPAGATGMAFRAGGSGGSITPPSAPSGGGSGGGSGGSGGSGGGSGSSAPPPTPPPAPPNRGARAAAAVGTGVLQFGRRFVAGLNPIPGLRWLAGKGMGAIQRQMPESFVRNAMTGKGGLGGRAGYLTGRAALATAAVDLAVKPLIPDRTGEFLSYHLDVPDRMETVARVGDRHPFVSTVITGAVTAITLPYDYISRPTAEGIIEPVVHLATGTDSGAAPPAAAPPRVAPPPPAPPPPPAITGKPGTQSPARKPPVFHFPPREKAPTQSGSAEPMGRGVPLKQVTGMVPDVTDNKPKLAMAPELPKVGAKPGTAPRVTI